jgi:DNA-binding NarL/FixJ family response regulator
MPITVLLVDDQVFFRGALRALLATIPEIAVVGEAADGASAVRLAGELSPDIVLMDVSLPDLDGIEATKQICRTTAPHPRVLILSGYTDDATRTRAEEAGATDLIEKGRALERLLPAIKAAAAP